MINLDLKPGKYVVAVSGGVDSVVLLDLISKLPDTEIVVAHFDHGMRKRSDLDRQLVEKLARKYGLAFEYAEGKLGKSASEATARRARYEFLHKVQSRVMAQAIITAHHQDDVLETTILNWLRGTGRRGLSSLRSTDGIIRPLLPIPKKDIINYALNNDLKWNEDATNKDEKYLRNYVRRQIISKLSPAKRSELIAIIQKSLKTNQVIDEDLTEALRRHTNEFQLDRQWFIQLPHIVSKEVMLAWLRQNGIYQIDRNRLEQLAIVGKTSPAGKIVDINKSYYLKIKLNHLALEPRDR